MDGNGDVWEHRPPPHVEPRWPIVLAVLVAIALQFALPNRHVLSPTFLFPTVEVLLLVVVVIANPSQAGRRATSRHRITLALVVLITVDNLAAVVEMVARSSTTPTPRPPRCCWPRAPPSG